MTFAPSVAMVAQIDEPEIRRSTRKPVSLVALSVQARETLGVDGSALPSRLLAAFGAVAARRSVSSRTRAVVLVVAERALTAMPRNTLEPIASDCCVKTVHVTPSLLP